MATPRAFRSPMMRNSTSTSGALRAEVGSSRIRMRGVLRDRLGDLDELLLPDAQVLDQRARIDARLQPLQQFAGAALLQADDRCRSAPRVSSRAAKMFSATDRLPKRFNS